MMDAEKGERVRVVLEFLWGALQALLFTIWLMIPLFTRRGESRKVAKGDDEMKARIEITAEKFLFEDEDLFLPKKAHPEDAAFDIRASIKGVVTIPPFGTMLIPAGFKMELEPGYEAQIRPRSGNALKRHLQIANAPGTIDSNYRGEVGVIVYNAGNEPLTIDRGEKIAQMVIQRLPEVEIEKGEVDQNTDRGEKGFGSTGK